MVEPGPVDTPLVQRTIELSKKVEFSQADNQSKKLFQQAMATLMDGVQKIVQSAEEIADLIKTLLQAEKPHFRYFTNAKYAPNIFEAKFVDMTGDSVVSKISQRFFTDNI